jgi:hypothetical protein
MMKDKKNIRDLFRNINMNLNIIKDRYKNISIMKDY